MISLTAVFTRTGLIAGLPVESKRHTQALVKLLRGAQRAEARGNHDTALQLSQQYLTLLESGVHRYVIRRHEQALRHHMITIVDRTKITLWNAGFFPEDRPRK